MKKQIKSFLKIINHFKNKNVLSYNKFAVFIYHRVLPYNNFDLSGSTVLQKIFIDQINYINNNFKIVNYKNLFHDKDNSSKIKALITFDNGYIDNYKYAYPILKKLNIPALFFIPTYYLNNKIIWDRYLSILLQYSNSSNKSFIIKNRNNEIIFVKKKNEKIKNNEFWKLINFFKKNNNINDIEKILDDIRYQLKFKNIINENDYCMSDVQIKELSENNISIGCHSHYHLSMSNYSNEKLIKELISSKKIIEKITDTECDSFAFPFGSKNDYSFNQFEHIKRIGFSNIFLNINGINKTNKTNEGIKRIILDNDTNLKYILG